MTGSLFSLPGTQYINVEHIHLVEERERQLPKDRRPRIQQGFAASLFLPLSLFSGNFWLQMTFRGGGGGGGGKQFLWGGGGFVPQCPGDGPPCPPGPARRAPGGPPRKHSIFLLL